MTTSVVGRLDAIQAEQYNMSIRLLSDGLAFALSYSSSEAVVEQGVLPLGDGYGSPEEAVRELMYRHPELLLPYHRVSLYYEPYFSTLIPGELFSSGELQAWVEIVGGMQWQGRPYQSLSYELADEPQVIASAWSVELYQFFRRTHLQLTAIPYYVPLLSSCRVASRQQQGTDLYLLLRIEGMEVFALREGALTYLNTFYWTMPSEARTIEDEVIFYVFSLWRSLALHAEQDRIHLCYLDSRPEHLAHIEAIMPHLRLRVRSVAHQAYATF